MAVVAAAGTFLAVTAARADAAVKPVNWALYTITDKPEDWDSSMGPYLLVFSSGELEGTYSSKKYGSNLAKADSGTWDTTVVFDNSSQLPPWYSNRYYVYAIENAGSGSGVGGVAPKLAIGSAVKPGSMQYLFYGMSRLVDISDLANWDVSKVTSFSHLFYNCSMLSDISPVSNWTTPNVEDLSYTFASCTSVAGHVDLTHWDVSKVMNMESMFSYCGLNETGMTLDIWGWKPVDGVNASRAFDNSVISSVGTAKYGLKTIYCNETWTIADTEHVFRTGSRFDQHCLQSQSNGSRSEKQTAHTDYLSANPQTGYFTGVRSVNPYATPDLVYDGTEKTGINRDIYVTGQGYKNLNPYDNSKDFTLSETTNVAEGHLKATIDSRGNAVGTDAGTYNVDATVDLEATYGDPVAGEGYKKYQWGDTISGSKDEKTKTVSFTISKAKSVISDVRVMPSGVVEDGDLTVQVSIKFLGDDGYGSEKEKDYTLTNEDLNAITVSFCGQDVHPTSKSGGVATATVKASEIGDQTLTVKFSGNNNLEAAEDKTQTVNVRELSKADIPVPSSPAYTGKKQTVFSRRSGYTLGNVLCTSGDVSDTSSYGVSGSDVFATHAGSYSFDATLVSGYKWSDGSKDSPHTITFTIDKATPTINVAAASGDIPESIEKNDTIKLKISLQDDSGDITYPLTSDDLSKLHISFCGRDATDVALAADEKSVTATVKATKVGSQDLKVAFDGNSDLEEANEFTQSINVEEKTTYDWALYQITKGADSYSGGYSGSNSPLVLVFSAGDPLPEEYTSAKYGNDLTQVATGKWDTTEQYLSKSRPGWYSNCERIYAIETLSSTVGASSGDETITVGSADKAGSLDLLFTSCSNLVDIKGLSTWDVSHAQRMNNTFAACSSLEDLSPIAKWDVSSIKYVEYLFSNCTSLNDLTPLSDWKFSALESMSYVFSGCSSITSLNGLQKWLAFAPNVTSLNYMFSECKALKDTSAIAEWDVSRISNLNCTFWNCSGIKAANLWSWHPAAGCKIGSLFSGCSNLETIYCSTSWNADDNGSGIAFKDCSVLSSQSSKQTFSTSSGTDMCNPTTGYFTNAIRVEPIERTYNGSEQVCVPFWSWGTSGLNTTGGALPDGATKFYTLSGPIKLAGSVGNLEGSEVDTSGAAYATHAGDYTVKASINFNNTNGVPTALEGKIGFVDQGTNAEYNVPFTIAKSSSSLEYTPMEETYTLDAGQEKSVRVTLKLGSTGKVLTGNVLDKDSLKASVVLNGSVDVTIESYDSATGTFTVKVTPKAGKIPSPNPQVTISFEGNEDIEASNPNATFSISVKTYTVDYQDGEGTWASSSEPTATKYVRDQTATLLDKEAVSGKLTPPKGSIFLGWSKTNLDKVLTKGGTQPEYVTKVTFNDVTLKEMDGRSAYTVYAVFGADSNGNGEADINEKGFELSFDKGVGGGTAPAAISNVLEGEKVDVPVQGEMTPPDSESNAIFLGWTEEKWTTTISEETLAKAGSNKQKFNETRYVPKSLMSQGWNDDNYKTQYTMPADAKTLYAAWGADANDNNWPDYFEIKIPLHYDFNGVSGDPAGLKNDEKYLPGATVELWSPDSSSPWKATLNDTHVVFAGWLKSNSGNENKIWDAAPSGTLKTIKMPLRDSQTVYAAWAADRNDNGKPDYEDDWATLTFDANDAVSPADLKATSLLEPVSDTPNTFKALDGTTVELPTPDPLWKRNKDENGHEPLFAGWSLTDYDGVFGQDGMLGDVSITSVLVTGEYGHSNYAVNYAGSPNVTFYAVYAANNNGDNTPDYLEPKVAVEYFANGGTRSGGLAWGNDVVYQDSGHVKGEKGVKLLDTTNQRLDLKKDHAVLIGWSAAQQADIPSDGEIRGFDLLTTVDIPSSGNAKVYAVWAADRNGDGEPDWEQDKYTITYDVNGGTADSGPIDEGGHLVNEKVDLKSEPVPTHDALASGADVLFEGWTSTDTSEKVYAYANKDSVPGTITQLTISEGEGANTVYALWAADENRNNQPDYNETKHALSYADWDGSSLTGVPSSLQSVNGTMHLPSTVTLWTTADQGEGFVWKASSPQRVWVGWSTSTSLKAVYGINDGEAAKNVITEQVTIADAPVTVRAVWAEDKNNNGKPDYDEKETLVSITFKMNGGKASAKWGAQSDFTERYLPGERITLPSYSTTSADNRLSWEKDPWYIREGEAAKSPAILAGWYYDEITDVILEDDGTSAAGGKELHEKLVGERSELYTVPSDKGTAFDLYAAYAANENGGEGNTTPDYLESAVNVEYYTNGGKVKAGVDLGAGAVTDGANGLFYRCLHHHVANEVQVQLYSVETGRSYIERENAVLIGWYYDREDMGTKPGLVTTTEQLNGIKTHVVDADPFEIQMPSEGNAKVCAVWAQDINHNEKPDYEETAHKLHYDMNGATSTPSKLVNDQTYLPGIEVTLWAQGDGDEQLSRTGATFIGWSKDQHEIYASAPGSGVLLERTLRMGDADVTVYAVWAKDDNGSGTPDYSEDLVTLTYDTNGGEAPSSLQTTSKHLHSATNTVTVPLWTDKGTGASAWHKGSGDDLAVFVGWTQSDGNEGKVWSEDPFDSSTSNYITKVTSVNMPQANAGSEVKVQAVWAKDVNNNGTPDYNDDWYTLKYDVNGATEGEPTGKPEDQLVLEGTSVELWKPEPTLKRTADTEGHAATFAGWSLTKYASAFDQNGNSSETTTNIKTVLVPSPYGITSDAAKDDDTITLYAVYAEDKNRDGTPDYTEDSLYVEYYSNGGTIIKQGVSSDPFFTCSDHHVAGETKVHLLSVDTGKTYIEKSNSVLIGWSQTAYESNCASKEEEATAGLLANNVIPTMPDKNAQVYAVWADDANGNNKPDYDDAKYTLTYHLNTSLGATGDDTTLPAGVDSVSINGQTITSGSSVPNEAYPEGQVVRDLLLNTTHDLKDLSETKRTDSKDGVTVQSYVFVGWSSDREGVVTKADTLSSLKLDGPLKMDANKDVYALWAYDENGNGRPDYDETLTLKYDGNAPEGRTVNAGSVPPEQTLASGRYTFKVSETTPTVASAEGEPEILFVGWSWSQDTKLYTMWDDAPENLVHPNDTLTVRQLTNGGGTLYAVWGVDEDGDDTPDVLEHHRNLRYEPGLGGGTDHTDVVVGGAKVQLKSATDSELNMSAPAGDGGRTVIFVGWTEDEINYILSKDIASGSVDLVNSRLHHAESLFTMPDKNVTLYAAWGYDEDGNGVPDYNQAKAHLTYSYENVTPPANKPVDTTYLVGQTVTLWSVERDNGGSQWVYDSLYGRAIFAGWTLDLANAGRILQVDTNPDDVGVAFVTEINPIKSDTTVYAVWAVDKNGSGGGGDGTPDYLQKDVTLNYLASASGDTYTTLASTPGCVKGYSYPLRDGTDAYGKPLTKSYGTKGETAVFVGWSPVDPTKGSYDDYSADDQALCKQGIIPANEHEVSHTTSAILSATIVGQGDGTYTIPADLSGNVANLYAIYAADDDGNGTPDYQQGYHHVDYYADGGVPVDENTTIDSRGVFFTCSHTHAGDDVAELMTVAEGRRHIKHVADASAYSLTPMDTRAASTEDGVLIGWGPNAHEAFIASEDELARYSYAGNQISSFGSLGDGQNASAYALWGADSNHNDVWDVREREITLAYDLVGGTGSPSSVPSATVHPGDSVTTPTGSWTLNMDGKAGVFYGWSTTKIDGVVDENGYYSRPNGQRYVLEKGSVIKGGSVYLVPQDASDTITLYAVYGTDANGAGGADYWENGHHVVYYANGGTYKGSDSSISVADGIFYTCAHNHVPNERGVELLSVDEPPASELKKDGCILIGWSEKKVAEPCKSIADETAAGLIKSETITMPRDGDANVYAVWAVDANGNHVPDYRDAFNQHVEYYANGGSAVAGSGVTVAESGKFYECLDHHTPGEENVHLMTLSEANERIAKKKCVLLGWSKRQVADVSSKAAEDASGLLADGFYPKMPITEGENAKVWAVWAVDADENGVPDYREIPETGPGGGGGGTPGAPDEPGDEEPLITVYRVYNPWTGEHLFTTDAREVRRLSGEHGDDGLGWLYEGYAWKSPVNSNVPVYRYYNPYSGDHLYTTSAAEGQALSANEWRYEGVCWFSDTKERVPIYRLFNPYEEIGNHLYTTDKNEYDTLPIPGWVQEGIGWYAADLFSREGTVND